MWAADALKEGVDQGKRVGELSEVSVDVYCCRNFSKSAVICLLLDEPTNDLDVETLRALGKCAMGIPGLCYGHFHDRWFLNRIATHIIDYQDEGKVEFFEGNFTEYEEYKNGH